MEFLKVIASQQSQSKQNWWQRLIVVILSIFIPQALKDEDKIDSVRFWLLEFVTKGESPNREIGIDDEGRVLMKMPDDRNYGYWTDNNLTYTNFIKTFETESITEEYFIEIWDNGNIV